MNVFELRTRLIDDYRAYIQSFISIADARLREHVDKVQFASVAQPAV